MKTHSELMANMESIIEDFSMEDLKKAYLSLYTVSLQKTILIRALESQVRHERMLFNERSRNKSA